MFTFVKERFGKMYSKNVLILLKIYFFIKYRKKKGLVKETFTELNWQVTLGLCNLC